jgi:hypothetical protein
MKLKSEMISNILKIMLWALVTLTTLSLIATVIYTIDSSFYMDSIYPINSFIDSLSTMLYILIIVIYLIWIYRVHMDLAVSFLALCIFVSKGLQRINLDKETNLPAYENHPEWSLSEGVR